MKKIKVLVSSPIAQDAVSSWRCLGPLNRLAKFAELEIVICPGNAGWVELTGCDVLMMHRPFAPQHVQFMAMARQYGVPIWADYDDDLLNVMDDNPTYHNYSRAEVKESVKKCLQLADHVTVTTEDLRDLYLPYNGNITLAPNAVDPRFFKYREKKLFSNAVWWRGSDSHQKDLMSHSSGIIEAYNATQDRMQWNFVGYRPWFLLPQMPKAQFHPGRDFRLFYDYLCDHNPDVLHVPLHDHVFNHSKSYIAAMEGSLAGAVIVAPSFKEWKQVPGLIHYTTPDTYGKAMLEAINLSPSEKKERREATAQWFLKERGLDKVNEHRLEVIRKLAGK